MNKEARELLERLKRQIELMLELPDSMFTTTTLEDNEAFESKQGGKALLELGDFLIKERFPTNMNQQHELNNTFQNRVRDELFHARLKHKSISSSHEGYAIILEELEEFWDEVKKNRNPSRMYSELIQISAMAQRTAEDCLLHESNPK